MGIMKENIFDHGKACASVNTKKDFLEKRIRDGNLAHGIKT